MYAALLWWTNTNITDRDDIEKSSVCPSDTPLGERFERERPDPLVLLKPAWSHWPGGGDSNVLRKTCVRVTGWREARRWEQRERERGEDRAGESNSPLTVSLTFWWATATRDEQGGGRETEEWQRERERERDRQRERSDVPLGSIFRIIYVLVFLLHRWRGECPPRLSSVHTLIVTCTRAHVGDTSYSHKHTFENTSKHIKHTQQPAHMWGSKLWTTYLLFCDFGGLLLIRSIRLKRHIKIIYIHIHIFI